MKSRIAAAFISAAIAFIPSAVFASGAIPDHRGTSMDGIEIGTAQLNSAVKSYSGLFKASGDRYGVDPNLLAAICMQESSGRNLSYRDDGTEYPAWGIMQIENSNRDSFAKFGLDTTGVAWTLGDRLDPEKSVAYAAHIISQALIRYDCDYMKMVQSYNFGSSVLDRIIAAAGDRWLDERKNAKNYVSGWPYDSYGDALYIEHVMRYYHNDIEYIGAKVRVNGSLVDFNDQFPVIEDGRTLIPVRVISEMFGAAVEWDGGAGEASITVNGTRIVIPLDSNEAYINGQAYPLDVPARLLNDRTVVPLRFIAESLGVTIDWDGDTRTVLIYK